MGLVPSPSSDLVLLCMDLQFWSPSRAQPIPARETELVPAIKDTGFPTPLAVRKGAISSVNLLLGSESCRTAVHAYSAIQRHAMPRWNTGTARRVKEMAWGE